MASDGIDLKEWRKFNRDIKAFKPDKQLKKTLRMAGLLIAEDAKAMVSPYSQTVPGSIRVKIRKTSVTIQAGGEGVPMAGLLEMGNRGRSSSKQKFRHPVFGDRSNWVDQDMHPYLLRATLKNTRAIERFEGEIVAEAFREIGWRGP